MKDKYGNIYYDEVEDLMREQENKLKSLIGKKIIDISAYSNEEYTEWNQPIIFVIENINLLIEVYDLEKLVLKWDCVIDDTYYSNKLKWGNKDNFFRKLINSKT